MLSDVSPTYRELKIKYSQIRNKNKKLFSLNIWKLFLTLQSNKKKITIKITFKLLIKDPANNEIGKIIIKNTLNFVIFINLNISVVS